MSKDTNLSTSSSKNLGFLALTLILVGSVIGAGIFDLPSNMSKGSGALGIIISWVISGLGMFTIVYAFQALSKKRPDIEGSIYAYAQELGGDFIGFNSAFGYWISAIIANIGYFVIIFSSIGYFFPMFKDGTTFPSLIGETILLWLIFILLYKGIKNATRINGLITFIKLIPLVFFIIVVFIYFKPEVFKLNFTNHLSLTHSSLLSQIKSTMLITVWVFIGVEGASIFSSRAKKNSHVSIATILGFCISILLLMSVSILSLGINSREVLNSFSSPSSAGVLNSILGFKGSIIIILGLILSVLGALLSWTLMLTEIAYIAGKARIFPKVFTKTNKYNSPSGALFISTILSQILLIISFFASQTYYYLVTLSASMIIIPYMLTAMFLVKNFIKSKYDTVNLFTKKDFIISLVAVIYSCWLIYAGGAVYLLLSMILYALGILIYIKAKKEASTSIFNNKFEKLVAITIIILVLIAVAYNS